MKILKGQLNLNMLYLIDTYAIGLIDAELTKPQSGVGCLGTSHFYPQ
jgi:hypothetical protein